MLRWDIGAGERLHHPQINFNCPEYLISHCFMCDRSLFERNDAKGDKFGQNMGIKLKKLVCSQYKRGIFGNYEAYRIKFKYE